MSCFFKYFYIKLIYIKSINIENGLNFMGNGLVTSPEYESGNCKRS